MFYRRSILSFLHIDFFMNLNLILRLDLIRATARTLPKGCAKSPIDEESRTHTPSLASDAPEDLLLFAGGYR